MSGHVPLNDINRKTVNSGSVHNVFGRVAPHHTHTRELQLAARCASVFTNLAIDKRHKRTAHHQHHRELHHTPHTSHYLIQLRVLRVFTYTVAREVKDQKLMISGLPSHRFTTPQMLLLIPSFHFAFCSFSSSFCRRETLAWDSAYSSIR